jgi:hypothetical protein
VEKIETHSARSLDYGRILSYFLIPSYLFFPTMASKFPESTTIAVMGKLKSANKIIGDLHKRINDTIDYLEKCIIDEPDNDADITYDLACSF